MPILRLLAKQLNPWTIIQMLDWRSKLLPGINRSIGSKDENAAKNLDFEEAANIRDKIKELRLKMSGKPSS